MVVTELREACARVAAEADHIRIQAEAIRPYAVSLPTPAPALTEPLSDPSERTRAAWYWLTMDAINFGSGWFPTLRKAPGASGYRTVSGGLQTRFDRHGAWSAAELRELSAGEIAAVLSQEPDHELMTLFATSLNDLGARLEDGFGGDPLTLVDSCGRSASQLVELLAGWHCFEDVSTYRGIRIPFTKRAQIAAADLARAGVAEFDDLAALTMFADNLVPHVLRLDRVLDFAPELVARIDGEELIEHGSSEEVEIRACAVHAVELIVADWPTADTGAVTAGQVDQLLWERGQGRLYKDRPRHRSRSTAY